MSKRKFTKKTEYAVESSESRDAREPGNDSKVKVLVLLILLGLTTLILAMLLQIV